MTRIKTYTSKYVLSMIYALLIFPCFAVAQAVSQPNDNVLLSSEDGFISVTGEIIGFSGAMVTVQTSVGAVRIPASEVTCTGIACVDYDFFPSPPPRLYAYKVSFNEGVFVFERDLSSEKSLSIDSDVFDRVISNNEVFATLVGRERVLALIGLSQAFNSPPDTLEYLEDPIVASLLQTGFINFSVPSTTSSNEIIRVQSVVDPVDQTELLYLRLQVLAEASAKTLFTEASSFSCEFSPRPETISPSVKTSFSVLGSTAEYVFQATFNVEKLCADLGGIEQ